MNRSTRKAKLLRRKRSGNFATKKFSSILKKTSRQLKDKKKWEMNKMIKMNKSTKKE